MLYLYCIDNQGHKGPFRLVSLKKINRKDECVIELRVDLRLSLPG